MAYDVWVVNVFSRRCVCSGRLSACVGSGRGEEGVYGECVVNP